MPEVPRAIPVPPPAPNPSWHALVTMTSGKIHRCATVLMFDVDRIRQAEQMQGEIEAKFRGFSTGIGFFGTSLMGVVTKAMALGLVEGAISQVCVN